MDDFESKDSGKFLYNGNVPKMAIKVEDLKGNDISPLFETMLDDDGYLMYKYIGDDDIECKITSVIVDY